MMAETRTRLQIRFDLDIGKFEENWLADKIKELKQARKFADMVRNGLRLMISLSAGETDVLLELFPWVGKELGVGQAVGESASAAQMNKIESKFDYLEQLILASSAISSSSTASGPRPLAAPAFAMPQFDEDDGVSQLIIAHKSDGSSAYNFVKNVSSLIQ